MKIDATNPTLARIYTANENIKGILERLEVIMDNNGYQELYKRYLEIAKEIPHDELLTEFERTYEAFGTDLKYTALDTKLRNFENELDIYNDYKELSDLLNKIKNDIASSFSKDFNINEFVERNKEFIDVVIKTKNNKTIHQFTGLFADSIKTLFSSLKTLSLIGNNELISFIKLTSSDYLKEHLAAEIRKSVDTKYYEGKLDEDYVDSETIYECALNDHEIIARQNEAKSYEERQAALALERAREIAGLKDKFTGLEESIKRYNAELKRLNLNKASLKAKRLFLRLVAVPAIAIPLSCPFIGRHIGLSQSSKVLLTKTITNTVDTDTGEIIATEDNYEELTTNYVASVTICEPWKKNVSGTSYTRDCVVYDYDFSDLGEVDDDFHLTLADIKSENLVKKYTYQEPTSKVYNKKYLTEQQVYITETYQDANDTKISKKYNLPYTVAGTGAGVIVGGIEAAVYAYAGKNLSDNLKRKIEVKLEENSENIADTNKILKKTRIECENTKRDYESLSKQK